MEREDAMATAEDSPWIAASLPGLAAAAARDALAGGHAGSDPVLAALYLEAGQFMHGACSLLASHLHETRGLPVLLIEGRPPGQGWMSRHAMACACGPEQAAAMVRDGRGLDVPVLDAAGGGTAGERLPLYRQAGWDFRAIPALAPGCASRWMWEPGPRRPRSGIEHLVLRLPALAHALGLPFDLRDALSGILADREGVPPAIAASGLPEWLAEGAPRP